MADEKAKEVKATEVKHVQSDAKHWAHSHKGALGLIGLTLLFLFLLCSAFALGRHADDRFNRVGHFTTGGTMQRGMDERGGMMRGSFGPQGDSGAMSNTSSTRVMGVVTAVDGDTITVAGNGVTTKVLVSTNTTYTGSDKPAQVNDTIMAFGARDGSNNLVASTVRLSRQ